MINTELKNVIKNNERYENFKLLDEPTPFDVLMKDKNFEVVQTTQLKS